MRKLITTAAIGAAFLLGTTTLVAASVPDADGTFHGCVNNATRVLRVVDPAKAGSLGSCITTGPTALRETAVSFNARGVPGAQGPQGAPGPQGPQGRQGPSGAPPAANTEVVGNLAIPDLFSGTVDVRGVSLGLDAAGTIGSATGGAGAGKTTFKPLQIVKLPDSASAALLGAAASHQLLTSATLELTDAGGTPYLTVMFKTVLVSSVAEDSSHAAGETVTLAFGGLELDPTAGTPPTISPVVATLSAPTGLPATSPLSALNWALANVGGATSKASLDDVAFVMPLDANFGALLVDAATGATLASLSITTPGGESYSLTQALVHTIAITATGAAGSVATGAVGMIAAQVRHTAGGTTFCWDNTTNTAC